MIVAISDQFFKNIFALIRQEAQKIGVTVLIFVAYDCDSLCACQIFTTCLKLYFIKYSVVGVHSYEHLDSAFRREMEGNSSVRSVVLINCGANIDLFDLLRLDKHKPYIFVFDTHRPFNKHNVTNMTQIFLLDDGSAMEEEEKYTSNFTDPDLYYDGSDEELLTDESSHRATSYGFTVAGIMYVLATNLQLNDNQMLWWGILGLTDQFVHQKIGIDRYQTDYNHFQDEVLSFNLQEGELSKPLAVQENHIKPESDYKFFLYRYWTLFNSMKYSRYFVTCLRLWSSKGIRRLEQLLARIGVSRVEYEQQYSTLPQSTRNLLHEGLDKYGEEFGLGETKYPSFTRVTFYDTVEPGWWW
eukprot:TRINITY_DN4313_c0_g1_i12.p1 TRINITY_DN4313_c0_g1~~TRINITY_DN4313_c0_g1_i12.p1  ORF type:complete len:356 (-),score=54.15 TRINITY_DN4313_c0_g1_i12:1061-2128(-)